MGEEVKMFFYMTKVIISLTPQKIRRARTGAALSKSPDNIERSIL